MTRSIAMLRRYRMHLAVILANAAFAAIFVTIALSGFHQPVPHDVPVGIVAPAPVAHEIEANVDAHMPGGFDLRSLPGEPQARAAIEHRQVDGALVMSSRGLDLLTAEAGGTAPTQTITTAFTAVAVKTGRPLTTIDVVPPMRDDSQALSSFFVILCVLFPSLATGVAAGHALRRAGLASRIGVLVAVAGVAGLAAAGIADGISGLGNYWAIAGIVALFSLAISATTAALGQIKPHLAALSVLAFLISGIPVSGGPPNLAAFAPSFLRSLHSGLPLGVAVDAIRNTVYFHAADTTGHLWVLTAYVAVGLAVLCLVVATGRRRRGDLSDFDARTAGTLPHAGETPRAVARTPDSLSIPDTIEVPMLQKPTAQAVRVSIGRVFAGAERVVLRHYGLRLTEPQPRIERLRWSGPGDQARLWMSGEPRVDDI
jgi:hypothetical protein